MAHVHDSIINQLLLEWPGARRSGFAKAMMFLASGLDVERINLGFLPDAFLIDPKKRQVILFEAVVSSDITDDKFHAICRFAFEVDDYRWDTILVRVDRYGAVAWHVFNTIVRGLHAGRCKNLFPADWRDMPKTNPRDPEETMEIVGVLTA